MAGITVVVLTGSPSSTATIMIRVNRCQHKGGGRQGLSGRNYRKSRTRMLRMRVAIIATTIRCCQCPPPWTTTTGTERPPSGRCRHLEVLVITTHTTIDIYF